MRLEEQEARAVRGLHRLEHQVRGQRAGPTRGQRDVEARALAGGRGQHGVAHLGALGAGMGP